MDGNKVNLEASWLSVLGDEFDKPYMRELKKFLKAQQRQSKVIYPPSKLWFNAFNSTSFDQVKLVILGQDPYHGPEQAHGLSFSVLKDVRIPPSLKNIFKEIEQDLGIPQSTHGCLQGWADQGVLLLNASLSVEQAKAGSHQGRGWEEFTDVAISKLNEQRSGLVFLLWGSYAQKKGQFIDASKHLVLKAPHPSPLSAYRGFFGCQHFSKANQYLANNGQSTINWQLE